MGPLNSKWFSMLLIILAGCLVFVLIEINVRRAEFEEAAQSVRNKVNEAEKENERLERFMAFFRSEQFMERQARAKLNYKDPDEEVAFVFRDPNAAFMSGVGPENTPNYVKWWHYVLGM